MQKLSASSHKVWQALDADSLSDREQSYLRSLLRKAQSAPKAEPSPFAVAVLESFGTFDRDDTPSLPVMPWSAEDVADVVNELG